MQPPKIDLLQPTLQRRGTNLPQDFPAKRSASMTGSGDDPPQRRTRPE
jgi:hypothetical protein